MHVIKKGQIIIIVILIVISFLGSTIPAYSFVGIADTGSIYQNSGNDRAVNSNPWWTSWPGDQDTNGLDDRLDSLVESSGGYTDDISADILIDYSYQPAEPDIRTLESMGLTLTYISNYINTVAVRGVGFSLLPELLTLPGVVMIEEQPVYVPLLDYSVPAMKVIKSSEYTNVARDFDVTGKGVVIAIIDTGVDDDHDSLDDDRYIAGVDYSGNRVSFNNPDDKDGHGTHVAGTALGNGGSDAKYVGVAPEAGLVDVKVFSDWTLTSADNVMKGIEWCIDNKDQYSIDILSLSIGELFTGDDDGTGSQAQLVNEAADAGLVVIVSAGNDGPENDGFSSLAAADKVITVGSIDEQDTIDRDDDEISEFSSRGPRADDGDSDQLDELKPDVTAPGDGIMSAMHAVSVFVDPGNNYIEKSGTSMSAPHVAGLAALLLEANPDLSPAEVKDIIRETSTPMGSPYNKQVNEQYSRDYGWGIVDGYEALKRSFGDFQRAEIFSFEEGDTLGGVVNIIGDASNDKGDIVKVELSFNSGSTWELATGTYSWNITWDTSRVSNGEFEIFVRTSNGTDYSKDFRFSVNVLNVLPTISYPDADAKVNGEVTIEGILATRHPINYVEIRIDDGDWSKALDRTIDGTWSTWYYEWDTDSVKDGTHTISARTFVDGVYSKEVSVSVRVKNDSDSSPGFDSAVTFIALSVVILIFIAGRSRKRRNNWIKAPTLR